MADPISDGAALARAHAGKYRVVDYGELRAKATDVAAQLLRDYKGQANELVLVPVLWGGGPPARLIVDTLLSSGIVRAVVPCRIRRYHSVGRAGEVEFTLPLRREDVAGHIVIGIDDMVDGGETMAAFLKHARELGTAAAEAAVIFAKPHSSVTPKYCAERGIQQWLVMPGEEHDFMANVTAQDETVQALSAAEAAKYFAAIGLDPEIINQWQCTIG